MANTKIKPTTPEGTLYARTMQLLSAVPILDLYPIAQETGLNYYWLRRMFYGYIPDPSVNRTQCLYEYLAKRKLEVK